MKLLSPKPTALPQPSFEGTVKLLPETPEDLWHAYNLAAPGDEIASTAIRKVTKESSTGSVDSQRIRLTLSVRLERVEFDPEGKVVWRVDNSDVDGRFADPCGGQLLANGNFVICSYGQKNGEKPKLFEVNRDKKVVWEYFNPAVRAHEVHVLTTNGEPEGAMK